MQVKLLVGIILGLLFISCGEENESKDEKEKKETKAENKDGGISVDQIKKIVIGDWEAYKVAESEGEELVFLPTTAHVFLVIKEDMTYFTTMNLDTLTIGTYKVEGDKVYFKDIENKGDGELRELEVTVSFDMDLMEFEGKFIEEDGTSEYHHSQFYKSKFDIDYLAKELARDKKTD